MRCHHPVRGVPSSLTPSASVDATSCVAPFATAFLRGAFAFGASAISSVAALAIAGALLPDFIGKYLLPPAHATMDYLAIMLAWMANWKWAIAWSSQPAWWALILSAVGIVISIRPGVIAQVWTFYNKSNSHSRPIFWREDFQRLWHRPALLGNQRAGDGQTQHHRFLTTSSWPSVSDQLPSHSSAHARGDLAP